MKAPMFVRKNLPGKFPEKLNFQKPRLLESRESGLLESPVSGLLELHESRESRKKTFQETQETYA